MTVDKSVLERIQKILNLANKDTNDNDHEALLAMERAHALMRRHGLSLADIETTNSDDIDVTVSSWSDDERSQYDTWVRLLAGASCRLFGVTNILHRSGASNKYRVKFSFIGEETDVELARSVWPWLVKYCRAACKKHFSGSWNARHRSFAESFAVTVSGRVDEIVEESKVATQQATSENKEEQQWGLVIHAKEQAVALYMDDHYPNLKKGKARLGGKYDPAAGNAGSAEGKKVNLNFRSQIGNSQAKQISG